MGKQDNIISLPRDKCPTEAEKKHMMHELRIDFEGQKRNQIQQYFILVL